MEEALNEYIKKNPQIKINLTKTVKFFWKYQPYILCEGKKENKISKVIFQRSQWLSNTEIHYCFGRTVEPPKGAKQFPFGQMMEAKPESFETDTEDVIWITEDELDEGHVKIYSYMENNK